MNVNGVLLLSLGMVMSRAWAGLVPQDVPPIQVRADGAIRIFLEKKYCIIEKNVHLTQNGMIIVCQKMKVFFENADALQHKHPKIKYIVAVDDVVVKRDQSTLTAEALILNVEEGILTAYPKNDALVCLVEKDRDVSVQARHMTYYIHKHCGAAKGCATLRHTRGNLRADHIDFSFSAPSKPPTSRTASRPVTLPSSNILARADGNVRIVYDDWKSISCAAIYNQETDQVMLRGNVYVRKGVENFGKTQCAVIDLKQHKYCVKSLPGQPSIFMLPGKKSIKQARRR